MNQEHSKQVEESTSIFSPVLVGQYTLKNRIAALPVYTGYAQPDGKVSSLLIEHYSRLSDSGAAIVVVANAAVSSDGMVSNHNLRIDGDEFIPGLRQLATTIKQSGARACLQLNHGGRFSQTDRPLLPSPIDGTNLAFNIASLKNFMEFFPLEKRFKLTRYFLKKAGAWRRAMSAGDIGKVIVSFGKSALRAYQAGFDMVEVHGANGYLICQFLSSFTNKIQSNRDSGFEARAAMPLAVIREIKKRVPEGFPVGFRLMLREWVPDGIDLFEALIFAQLLQEEGIAYLSASVGSYNSIFTAEAIKKMDPPAYLKKDMITLKSRVGVPTIISGRIIQPAIAEELIRDGATDLIGLGRPLRVDARWIKKASHHEEKITACINCNWCLKRVVMDQGFNCRQWSKVLQARTDLEHKLLSRNDKTLWVVVNRNDLNLLKDALPHFLPGSSKSPSSLSPTILFLKTNTHHGLSHSDRNGFVDWSKSLLHRSGDMDIRIDETTRLSSDSFEKAIHAEIDRGGHGVVFVGRDRNEPWRERLLYQERSKVVGLVGSNPRYTEVLVPVDLSDTTLLVLMLLRRNYFCRSGLNFQFVHVLQDTADGASKRWQEMMDMVGFDAVYQLTLTSSKGDIAAELLKTIRYGNYGTIIMGKRGLSGIKRWMLGSVSHGVLQGLTDQTLFLID